MGTRSITHIRENGQTLVSLYIHFDGYPTGVGADILAALDNGQSKLVNGYGVNASSPRIFNGMGCLAAYLIAALKYRTGKDNALGNVYVIPPNTKGLWEEYAYTLNADDTGPIMLTVEKMYTGKNIPLYHGPLAYFDPEKTEETDNKLMEALDGKAR